MEIWQFVCAVLIGGIFGCVVGTVIEKQHWLAMMDETVDYIKYELKRRGL